jgi:hypothetical protein
MVVVYNQSLSLHRPQFANSKAKIVSEFVENKQFVKLAKKEFFRINGKIGKKMSKKTFGKLPLYIH